MKILIIGKRNPSFLLIGKSLRENIKQSKIHYVSDSYLNTPFSFTKINLRSASLINEVINDFNPDFILHNIPLSLDKKSLFCEEFNINKILTEIKSSLLEINLSEKTLTDVIPLFDNIDKRVIINYDKFSVLDLQLLLEYLQKKDFNNFILKVSKPNADLSKLLNYKIPFLFEIFSMDDLILKLNSIRQLKQNNIIIPIIKAKNEVHDIIFKLIKERVFTIFLETPIKLDFLKREEYSNFEVKFIKNNSYLPNYNFFLNKEKKEVRRNILKIQKVKEQLLCEFNILNDYNILKNDLKDKQNKLLIPRIFTPTLQLSFLEIEKKQKDFQSLITDDAIIFMFDGFLLSHLKTDILKENKINEEDNVQLKNKIDELIVIIKEITKRFD